jgi:hypothetical protein
LALGDSPDKPIYVETIPRQGYSFVGTVAAAAAGAISRNGNGGAAGIEGAQIPAGAEGALQRVEAAPVSSWFVAGVVALVLAGMLFGAAAVMYLHR